ncbi:MAG: class I SAM-dependent methyltransferase [Candidatus Aminicenantes bacterium]
MLRNKLTKGLSIEGWKDGWNPIYKKIAEFEHKEIYEAIEKAIENRIYEFSRKYNKRELNIWDLGSNFKIWELKEFDSININIHSFDLFGTEISNSSKIDCANKKTYFFKQDLFEENIEDKLQRFINNGRLHYPNIIISKHFFTRYNRNDKNIEDAKKSIKRNIKKMWNFLEPEGIFIIVDILSIDDINKEETFDFVEKKISYMIKHELLRIEDRDEAIEMWYSGILCASRIELLKIINDLFVGEEITSHKKFNDSRNSILLFHKKPNVFFDKDTDIFSGRMDTPNHPLTSNVLLKIFNQISKVHTKDQHEIQLNVLDVGIGNLRFTKGIFDFLKDSKEIFPNIKTRLFLNDINKKYMDYAKDNLKSENMEFPSEYLPGDFFDISIEGIKFKIIFLNFMFHITYFWEALIKKAFDLLEDCGYLIGTIRFDKFSQYRSGIFLGESEKKELEIFSEYWQQRNVEKIRTYEYLFNNNFITDIMNEIRNVGFKLDQFYLYSVPTKQEISIRQFRDEFWSYFSVGLLKEDREFLYAKLRDIYGEEFQKHINLKTNLISFTAIKNTK